MRRLIPIVLITSLLLFFFVNVAEAGQTDNVFGWAWSENIGWISFNCYNDYDGDGIPESHCAPDPGYASDYGVNVDLSTGDFSGYAWSENIGWIKFDQPLFAIHEDFPGLPGGPARLDWSNNEVSGWFRACSGTINGDCNSASRTDGWDGWIKARCNSTECTTSNYGMSFNPATKEFEGWAWGSDVVGWISFNAANCDPDGDGFSNGLAGCPTFGESIPDYKVLLYANFPPYIEFQTVDGQAYCGIGPGKGQVSFRWTYRDPDLDPEAQFDFRINDTNDVNDLNWEVDRSFSGLSNSDGTTNNQTVLVEETLSGDNITYNTTYYWWVRVWDDQGNNSGWIAGPSFTTELHPYPWANFTCDGIDDCSTVTIIEGVPTHLADSSTAYGGTTIDSWLWTLPSGATIVNGTITSPELDVEFPAGQNQPVTLKVTDSSFYSCSITESLDVSAFLPKWREVPPTGLLEKILANIFNILKFI